MTTQERFDAKVDRRWHDGCWLWTAYKDRQGYGQFRYKGKVCPTHRAAYELLVGPIPDGLFLDHLCCNPSCVNPDHLEPVTNAENLRRSGRCGNKFQYRTHCKNGHEFTPENTHRWESADGKRKARVCRACHRENQRRFVARKGAA